MPWIDLQDLPIEHFGLMEPASSGESAQPEQNDWDTACIDYSLEIALACLSGVYTPAYYMPPLWATP